jgi:hypothetical protein
MQYTTLWGGGQIVKKRKKKKSDAAELNEPAKYPTSLKLCVRAKIAPDIGGPPNAPSDKSVIDIPILLPASTMGPITMTGEGTRAMYTPVPKP